jgi:hypothetical protein
MEKGSVLLFDEDNMANTENIIAKKIDRIKCDVLVFSCFGELVIFSPANAVYAEARFDYVDGHEHYSQIKKIMFQFYDFAGKDADYKLETDETFTYTVSSGCLKFLKALKESIKRKLKR